MTTKDQVKAIVLFVAGIIAIITSFKILETNSASEYQIKEAFISGDVSVRSTPGTYLQNLGSIETYDITQNASLENIQVLFPEGFAVINIDVQFETNISDDVRKDLHIRFKSSEGVKNMVVQQIIEAIQNTGSLMSAEEAYTHKRADFIKLSKEQALVGLYKAKVIVETTKTASGQEQIIKKYDIDLDQDGNPIVMKKSLLGDYGFKLAKYNVNIVDFDEKLKNLIDSRKEAQLAQQAAITEKAKGDQRIAKEKADQEVLKIKEVTVAEKLKEVAILNAEKEYQTEKLMADKAKETAKKIEAEGMANAAANRALVAAGLTPLERAQIDKETAIGVATEMAKMKFPEIMIFGGGNNSPMNPFDAVGLDAFMKISKEVGRKK
jgi:hypothetical protein